MAPQGEGQSQRSPACSPAAAGADLRSTAAERKCAAVLKAGRVKRTLYCLDHQEVGRNTNHVMKLTALVCREIVLVQSGTFGTIGSFSCWSRVLRAAGHPSLAQNQWTAGLSSLEGHRESIVSPGRRNEGKTLLWITLFYPELLCFSIFITFIIIQCCTQSSVWWQVLCRAEYNGLLFSFAAATLYYSLVWFYRFMNSLTYLLMCKWTMVED